MKNNKAREYKEAIAVWDRALEKLRAAASVQPTILLLAFPVWVGGTVIAAVAKAYLRRTSAG